MERIGIDVSQWQGSGVDFKKVKAAGIKYVILRAGFGRTSSQIDPTFEANYKKAKEAGLDVGAYWYSYASSAEDAKQEAKACLQVIKGKKFEYPIYFDLEENAQFARGRDFCSSLVKAFCNEIEAAGYWAGLYTGRAALQSYITKEVANRYALWVAEWASRLNYSGSVGMWQYTDSGKINGINGNVDMNKCYIDYPAEIKKAKLNGYKKTASSKTETKPKTDTKPKNEKKPAAKNYTTYTVKKGDTLWDIAQAKLKNGSRYKEIVKLNNLLDPDTIYAGQKLKIPKA